MYLLDLNKLDVQAEFMETTTSLIMLQNFNNLAEKLTTINERYKNINEITGESFNVFRILKLESAEVRMHSAYEKLLKRCL